MNYLSALPVDLCATPRALPGEIVAGDRANPLCVLDPAFVPGVRAAAPPPKPRSADEYLRFLLETGDGSDCRILSRDGSEFAAHWFVLCGRCAYFDAMFLPPWEEAATGVVRLHKSPAAAGRLNRPENQRNVGNCSKRASDRLL